VAQENFWPQQLGLWLCRLIGVVVLPVCTLLAPQIIADAVWVEGRIASFQQAAAGSFGVPQALLDTHWLRGSRVPIASRDPSAMLQLNPLDPKALWSLAVESDPEDPARTGRLARLASQVSRRHVPAQIWLLEEHVAAGQVNAALKQYDLLLSLRPEASARLVPILLEAASASPAVRIALARYVRRPWFAPLLSRAAQRPDRMDFLPLLKAYLRTQHIDKGASAAARQLAGHVSDGQFEMARSLHTQLSIIPAAVTEQFAITPVTSDPRWGVLTWQPVTAPELFVDIDARRGDMMLRLAPDEQVVFLQRTTLLQPGRYRLGFVVGAGSIGELPELGLDVACLLGPNGARSGPAASYRIRALRVRSYVVELDVPRDCPSQTWRWSAAGGGSQLPSSLRLGPLTLDLLHAGVPLGASAADERPI
jgi:hypothetical protein